MELSQKQLASLGTDLKRTLEQYITDRPLLETQWLINLRQYMGTYDPSITIDPERSHVYPRDTRVKVKGGVAKLMEMMFPAQDRNWGLSISPNPSIPETELQRIIDTLQGQADVESGGIPSDMIEREVRKFATERMEKMEQEIHDQLVDSGVDYPQICKRVVRSGYVYGAGIARSPMVRTQEERQWQLDPMVGRYVAVNKKHRRPYPEYCRIWDIYMDLSAKQWDDQELIFERFVLSRHDFKALANREDFIAEAITEYLRNNPQGNYKAKTYEEELHTLTKTSNLADRTARRYEVYRALGFVSGNTLQGVGIDLTDEEATGDVFVDLWFIGDTVIKAKKAAFGEKPTDQYHAFIYTEDEDTGLTGMGLPEEVRDSQMSLCASTRALMDNMAAVAGPIFEVNTTLLPKGRRSIGAIHAFMTIEREGDGTEASYPAIRPIATQSHVPEILSIIAMQRQQLDVESNLPAYTMGSMQQPLGEAFRTSNNMSMMMGSANMVTKDTVRAFDKFTTSLITSLLKWNMEFNEREEIKGDYQVQARGNMSLVAKEVRGAALDQFVMTLTPEERGILDTYGLLVDRLKARDLPVDRVLPKEEAQQVLQGMREAASQASQIEQGLTQAKTADVTASAEKKKVDSQVTAATADAVIAELMARVAEKTASAQSKKDKTQLENLSILLQTIKPKGAETA